MSKMYQKLQVHGLGDSMLLSGCSSVPDHAA